MIGATQRWIVSLAGFKSIINNHSIMIRFIAHRVYDGYINEETRGPLKPVGKRYPSSNLCKGFLGRKCIEDLMKGVEYVKIQQQKTH